MNSESEERPTTEVTYMYEHKGTQKNCAFFLGDSFHNQ